MTDVRKIEHWSDLQLSDLFYAYRKAKADCFFERQICVAEKFVAFEKDIFANLNGLLENLRKGNIKQLLLANLGEPVLVAKKLGLEKRSEGPDGHGFFSQPERAFDYLLKTHTLIPEFRL